MSKLKSNNQLCQSWWIKHTSAFLFKWYMYLYSYICQNDSHTVASTYSYSNSNDLLYPIVWIISLVWYLTFLFVNIWTKIFIYNCYWYELDRRSSSHYIYYFCIFLSLSHEQYRAIQKIHLEKINMAHISSYNWFRIITLLFNVLKTFLQVLWHLRFSRLPWSNRR